MSFMQSKYNLDEIWFQPSNYKNNGKNCKSKCKRPDSFRLRRHFLDCWHSTLFRVTVKNISCGDWRLHLVLRTQFSCWCGWPRCHLPLSPGAFSPYLFRPVVFAPCFSFHVYSPSLLGAYSLDSLSVTFTFSLVCILPSVPTCWRTTYCPIEACTFDFFPFPSRRVAGFRTFLTNAATMRELPLDPRSRCSSV